MAEGNENGPTISYRGIDNRTYYLMKPDGSYVNYSGCGNTMNCNNAVVRSCIRDCLRYWVSEYHIDGFPVLRSVVFDRGENNTGYPELSFHGETPWQMDMSAPSLTFAFMYAEDHQKYGVDSDSFIYVMVNAHWEAHRFRLPIIPAGFYWYLSSESGGRSFYAGDEEKMKGASDWVVGPRMTVVLIAKM